MPNRLRSAVATAVATLSAAALTLSASAPALADASVNLTDSNQFAPAHVTVTAGDTVTFVWQGGFHNIVFDDGETSGTPTGDVGASWDRTFAEPGTYPYLCAVHGTIMAGQITVTAAAADPPVAADNPASGAESADEPAAAADAAPTYPYTGPEPVTATWLGAALLIVGLLGLRRTRRGSGQR